MTGVEILPFCPLCHGNEKVFLPVPRVRIGDQYFSQHLSEFKLVKCLSCGLKYVNPRPAPSLLLGFYEQAGYSSHDPNCGEGFHRERLNLIAKYSKGFNLLDLGCGGGNFLREAQRSGYFVTGVEPSSQGRNSALKLGCNIQSGLTPVIQSGQVFDVVSAWHVMEHVSNIDKTMKEVHSILGKDGIFIVAVPNVRSARSMLFDFISPTILEGDERYRAFPIHLYGFSRSTLFRLMEKNGFSPIKTTTQYFALDEMFASIRSQRAKEGSHCSTDVKSGSRFFDGRLFKMFIKSIFFGLLFGESLVMIGRKND